VNGKMYSPYGEIAPLIFPTECCLDPKADLETLEINVTETGNVRIT